MVIKIIGVFWKKLFLDKTKIKSRAGFRKWTFLKMSKIEKPKILLKKDPKITLCDQIGLIYRKNTFQYVSIFFFIFFLFFFKNILMEPKIRYFVINI